MLMFHGKDGVDPNQRRLDMMANLAAPKRGRQPKARKPAGRIVIRRCESRWGYVQFS
jgi:hypothetical protein